MRLEFAAVRAGGASRASRPARSSPHPVPSAALERWPAPAPVRLRSAAPGIRPRCRSRTGAARAPAARAGSRPAVSRCPGGTAGPGWRCRCRRSARRPPAVLPRHPPARPGSRPRPPPGRGEAHRRRRLPNWPRGSIRRRCPSARNRACCSARVRAASPPIGTRAQQNPGRFQREAAPRLRPRDRRGPARRGPGPATGRGSAPAPARRSARARGRRSVATKPPTPARPHCPSGPARPAPCTGRRVGR